MTKQEVNAENGKEQETNVEEETELETAIIRQVEYYFSDVNLIRDKFLCEQIKLDDGWVPLDVLITFQRLAKLSADTEVIAAALNKSTSGLIEVSVDNKKVRRSPEMPVPEMNEERRKELQERTIYAKGFPKDSELDPLLKFFKEHGDVETVTMRRYLDKATKTWKFTGSVFATFKDREQAVKFVENKGIKYGDTELVVLWQQDFLQKQQQAENSERKEKRDKKYKENKSKGDEKDRESLKDSFKRSFTGTVFHFSEAKATSKREDIRDALVALGAEVAYIDFKVGDTKGWVRLAKKNAAKFVKEFQDGKLKIGEKDVAFKLLEGDEEKAYFVKSAEDMLKRRQIQKTFSKVNKNRGYKGKGMQQGRKRKQGQHEGAPANKVKA